MTRTIGYLIIAAFLLAGCTSSDFVNLLNDDHAPGYQRVNTVEKAQAFYPDTTLVSRFVRYIDPDGAPVSGDLIPVGSRVEPAGFTVEYFGPSGVAYRATSDRPSVQRGAWEVEQFGRAYPRVCTTFPDASPARTCFWPSLFLGSRDRARLYPGDITGVGVGRYPGGLRSADPNQSIQSVVSGLSRGTPEPFTAE